MGTDKDEVKKSKTEIASRQIFSKQNKNEEEKPPVVTVQTDEKK